MLARPALNWLKSSSCSGPTAIIIVNSTATPLRLPIVLVTQYSFTDVLEQES